MVLEARHKLIVSTISLQMHQVSEFRVRYSETDQMGVVYHANYLAWCEVGRTDLIRALGKSYADVEREGVSLAVAEAQLRYKRGAQYDDVVRVVTRVSNVRSRFITFDYDIMRADGTPLVTATTTLVAVGRDGRSTSLPPDIRQALENAIEN
jgi:acyl-CoA thioester hydrolase